MKLFNILSDGAVLQRDSEIRIFGEGHGKVHIEFDGFTAETEADGEFTVTLPSHKAGGPYELLCRDNEGEIILHDILIGEVIFAAGQSNMELTVAETFDAEKHFEADGYLRFFNVTRPTNPDKDNYTDYEFGVGGYFEKWVSITPENANDMSAIGLHTAIMYRKKYGVPVGVIGCYKGATVIQTFLSPNGNAKFPYDREKMHYDHSCGWNIPSLFYEKMLLPIFPYSVGKAIFYQGESNRTVFEAGFYGDMLKEFISEIREGFKNPNLPFAVIQINKYPEQCEEGVIAIREAQEKACAETEKCGIVKIDDMGEHALIHPRNKKEVAERVFSVLEEIG